MIKETEYVHRFPLMLDAIFKEDIDDDNRATILNFIHKNKPNDIQMIISIADSKDNKTTANEYNAKFLNNESNLICINNSIERAFLAEYKNEYNDYLEETFSYLNE